MLLEKPPLLECVRDDDHFVRVPPCELPEAKDGEDEVLVGVRGVVLEGQDLSKIEWSG